MIRLSGNWSILRHLARYCGNEASMHTSATEAVVIW